MFSIPDLFLGPGRPAYATHSFSHCFIGSAPLIDIQFDTELTHLRALLLVITQGTYSVSFDTNNKQEDLQDQISQAPPGCTLAIDGQHAATSVLRLREVNSAEGSYLVFYSIPHLDTCVDISVNMHTEDVTSRLALSDEGYLLSKDSAEAFGVFLQDNIRLSSSGSLDLCVPPLEHLFMYVELQIPSTICTILQLVPTLCQNDTSALFPDYSSELPFVLNTDAVVAAFLTYHFITIPSHLQARLAKTLILLSYTISPPLLQLPLPTVGSLIAEMSLPAFWLQCLFFLAVPTLGFGSPLAVSRSITRIHNPKMNDKATTYAVTNLHQMPNGPLAASAHAAKLAEHSSTSRNLSVIDVLNLLVADSPHKFLITIPTELGFQIARNLASPTTGWEHVVRLDSREASTKSEYTLAKGIKCKVPFATPAPLEAALNLLKQLGNSASNLSAFDIKTLPRLLALKPEDLSFNSVAVFVSINTLNCC